MEPVNFLISLKDLTIEKYILTHVTSREKSSDYIRNVLSLNEIENFRIE